MLILGGELLLKGLSFWALDSPQFEDVVGDVVVIHILALVFLNRIDHTDGDRKHDDFVHGLQYHLPEHQPRQF